MPPTTASWRRGWPAGSTTRSPPSTRPGSPTRRSSSRPSWCRKRGGGGGGERRRAQRVGDLEVLQEHPGRERVHPVHLRQSEGGDGGEPRLQHAVPEGPVQEADALPRQGRQAGGAAGPGEAHGVPGVPGADDAARPGGRDDLHHPRYVHEGGARRARRGHDEVGRRRDPAHLRQAQVLLRRMTQVSPGGPSPPGPLSLPAGARAWGGAWWRTPTARRYLFGYVLLAPAVLYVALLVGVPFLFSLYLAMSDAS